MTLELHPQPFRAPNPHALRAAGTEVVEEPRIRTRHAPRVRVLLHDDDVTPMDFVVRVLREVFGLPGVDAWSVMYEAHGGGVALVEVVPLEVAELHVEKAHLLARTHALPLTFTIEPE